MSANKPPHGVALEEKKETEPENQPDPSMKDRPFWISAQTNKLEADKLMDRAHAFAVNYSEAGNVSASKLYNEALDWWYAAVADMVRFLQTTTTDECQLFDDGCKCVFNYRLKIEGCRRSIRIVEPGSRVSDGDLQVAINETIQSPPKDKRSLDELIGSARAKTIFKEAIIMPMKTPRLFCGKLTPWAGLIMYGLPGTGKTEFARIAASDGSSTFFSASASNLMSRWIGESGRLITLLFKTAIERAPSIIFLDEIDSLVAESDHKQGEEGQHRAAFLLGISAIVEHNDRESTRIEEAIKSNTKFGPVKRVFLIGATNRPQDIPETVVRRFNNNLIAVDLPTPAERSKLVTHFLKGMNHTILEQEITDVCTHPHAKPGSSEMVSMDMFSGADISTMCTTMLYSFSKLKYLKWVRIDDDGLHGYVFCKAEDAMELKEEIQKTSLFSKQWHQDLNLECEQKTPIEAVEYREKMENAHIEAFSAFRYCDIVDGVYTPRATDEDSGQTRLMRVDKVGSKYIRTWKMKYVEVGDPYQLQKKPKSASKDNAPVRVPYRLAVRTCDEKEWRDKVHSATHFVLDDDQKYEPCTPKTRGAIKINARVFEAGFVTIATMTKQDLLNALFVSKATSSTKEKEAVDAWARKFDKKRSDYKEMKEDEPLS